MHAPEGLGERKICVEIEIGELVIVLFDCVEVVINGLSVLGLRESLMESLPNALISVRKTKLGLGVPETKDIEAFRIERLFHHLICDSKVPEEGTHDFPVSESTQVMKAGVEEHSPPFESSQ
jgi:hypothetical protein